MTGRLVASLPHLWLNPASFWVSTAQRGSSWGEASADEAEQRVSKADAGRIRVWSRVRASIWLGLGSPNCPVILWGSGRSQGWACPQNVGNSFTMNTIKMTVFVKWKCSPDPITSMQWNLSVMDDFRHFFEVRHNRFWPIMPEMQINTHKAYSYILLSSPWCSVAGIKTAKATALLCYKAIVKGCLGLLSCTHRGCDWPCKNHFLLRSGRPNHSWFSHVDSWVWPLCPPSRSSATSHWRAPYGLGRGGLWARGWDCGFTSCYPETPLTGPSLGLGLLFALAAAGSSQARGSPSPAPVSLSANPAEREDRRRALTAGGRALFPEPLCSLEPRCLS